jgi:lactoylglutathione lyase
MKNFIAIATLVAMTSGLTFLATYGSTVAEEKAVVEFSRGTIDFGIVCSDVEKSVAFYRDVVGMKEIDGFDVPASLAADAGLVDNHDLHVHVLVTQEASSSTRLKLMQIKDAPGKKVDHAFIHSSLGMSYSTIWVTDIDASLARAAAGNVKPIAKGPVALPNGIFLAVIRDPDGNFVELVGPKRK